MPCRVLPRRGRSREFGVYLTSYRSLSTAAVLIKRKFTIEEIAGNYYDSIDLFGGGWY